MNTTKDIQIGDWLLDVNGLPKRVEEIYDDSVALGSVLNHMSTVKPIPITPEILEKNGFDLTYETVARKVFDLVLPRKNNDCDYFCVMLNERTGYGKFDYNPIDKSDRITFSSNSLCVHHLQHALSVFNIEKDIDL